MIFEYQSKLFFCFYPHYPTAVRFWRRKDTAFFIPANFFRKIVGVFRQKAAITFIITPLPQRTTLISESGCKGKASFLKMQKDCAVFDK